MRQIGIWSFIVFLLLLLTVKGQENRNFWYLDEFFGSSNEIYFRFSTKNTSDLHLVNEFISIDHKTDGDWIYAYANKSGFAEFLKLNPDFEIQTPPGKLYKPEMRSNIDISEVKAWDFYPTYDAYVDIMYQFEASFPELCDVFSIGKSVEGRDLLFAKISKNIFNNEPEPRFMYTATIHGDETTGYILMLHLIDYMLSNYGSNDLVTHLVDNLEIWINPLANPDGTYALGNNSVYGATRFNANGIDLNRNFPDPDEGPHPHNEDWEPETLEFMALADSLFFTMSANFHGGAEVFNYPWDTWPRLHADDDWWQMVGRQWADSAQFYSPDGYFNDQNNGITNGYAWYTLAGGRQDYMNYFNHCREVTVEISNIKLMPENQLENYWEYNYRSFIHYMEQALYGVHGFVTDSVTGNPLQASITFMDHDEDNSWTVSGYAQGSFFRMANPGIYDLLFEAAGHTPKVIEGVEVLENQSPQLDVQLTEGGAGISTFKFDDIFNLYPNPFDESVIITYNKNNPVGCLVEIFDPKGQSFQKKYLHFQTNERRVEIPISTGPPGLYIVKITSGQFEVSKKIIKK
ncbi:MAG: T9SS type A sorting domain-containing protein [Bacteroidales bacterium]|nr:T9SS type A sorting domain-containing protein [Bacteroidales bacterium]